MNGTWDAYNPIWGGGGREAKGWEILPTATLNLNYLFNI